MSSFSRGAMSRVPRILWTRQSQGGQEGCCAPSSSELFFLCHHSSNSYTIRSFSWLLMYWYISLLYLFLLFLTFPLALRGRVVMVLLPFAESTKTHLFSVFQNSLKCSVSCRLLFLFSSSFIVSLLHYKHMAQTYTYLF